jgi:hypothetical protein
MLTREIIQRIQSLYSKGVQSDDSRLTPRHIYNKILTVRSKLISQEAKKRQKINQWSYQTIPCIELIKAEVHECPCLPPLGCEILRSKYPIPKPMTDLNTHLIQSVTTLDGSVIFSEITWNEKKYKASNKYTANKPDYYIRNNYLYITHRSGLKVITLTGLFDDPITAEDFPSFCEDCTDCEDCTSPLDKEFPIDNDMIDTLIDICKQELIEQFSQMIEDSSNNSSDTLPETSK